MESRSGSASSRTRFARRENLLPGSICWSLNLAGRIHEGSLLIGGGRHHQSVNRFDAPIPLHQLARQPVEQFGMGGRFPMLPKSFGVSTSPRPKCCCQRRLTITRAVSGFQGSVSHFASAVRRPLEFFERLDLRGRFVEQRQEARLNVLVGSPFFGIVTGAATVPTSVAANATGSGAGLSASNFASSRLSPEVAFLVGPLDEPFEPVVFVGDLSIGQFCKLVLKRCTLLGGLANHRFDVRREFRDRLLGGLLSITHFELVDLPRELWRSSLSRSPVSTRALSFPFRRRRRVFAEQCQRNMPAGGR